MADSESDRSLLSPENLQVDEENTSLDEVKAPNVFDMVKEEIEAFVQSQTIDSKDESVATESKEEETVSKSDREVIAEKVHGRARNGIGKMLHSKLKETLGPEGEELAAKVYEKAKEKAKDGIGKMFHIGRSKETHGPSDDIEEVKAPNLLERAVEEYEAVMQTIHSKKESQTDDKRDETDSAALLQKDATPLSEISSNEKIPINEVKGLSIFDRATGEMEALVHTLKKETDSPEKEGFLSKLGKCFEIICSPSKKKDD